jgi:hypothetical protein
MLWVAFCLGFMYIEPKKLVLSEVVSWDTVAVAGWGVPGCWVSGPRLESVLGHLSQDKWPFRTDYLGQITT